MQIIELPIETWKDIKGFEGYYQVSNLGRVKSLKRDVCNDAGDMVYEKPERILRGYKHPAGYVSVDFRINKKRTRFLVHVLVANAFIKNPCKKPFVNHKDGNKTNNNTNNLEFVTPKENIVHALDIGLSPHGEKHPGHKLTNGAVAFIRDNYIPRDRNFGQSALARKFGVSRSAVSMVVHGKQWRRA